MIAVTAAAESCTVRWAVCPVYAEHFVEAAVDVRRCVRDCKSTQGLRCQRNWTAVAAVHCMADETAFVARDADFARAAVVEERRDVDGAHGRRDVVGDASSVHTAAVHCADDQSRCLQALQARVRGTAVVAVHCIHCIHLRVAHHDAVAVAEVADQANAVHRVHCDVCVAVCVAYCIHHSLAASEHCGRHDSDWPAMVAADCHRQDDHVADDVVAVVGLCAVHSPVAVAVLVHVSFVHGFAVERCNRHRDRPVHPRDASRVTNVDETADASVSVDAVVVRGHTVPDVLDVHGLVLVRLHDHFSADAVHCAVSVHTALAASASASALAVVHIAAHHRAFCGACRHSYLADAVHFAVPALSARASAAAVHTTATCPAHGCTFVVCAVRARVRVRAGHYEAAAVAVSFVGNGRVTADWVGCRRRGCDSPDWEVPVQIAVVSSSCRRYRRCWWADARIGAPQDHQARLAHRAGH